MNDCFAFGGPDYCFAFGSPDQIFWPLVAFLVGFLIAGMFDQ